VRPRGTHEDRADLFKDGDSYIGKKLTVRYQELTEDGIPRFPVGIAFRDYE
jgi:DNA ligase-1